MNFNKGQRVSILGKSLKKSDSLENINLEPHHSVATARRGSVGTRPAELYSLDTLQEGKEAKRGLSPVLASHHTPSSHLVCFQRICHANSYQFY